MYSIENNIYKKETNIYGESLFAKRDFVKNELVFIAYGPIVTEANFYTIPIEYKSSLKHYLFIEPRIPDGNLSQYICHSCEPNLGIKNRTEFVAMSDIKKDDEITIDYAMIVDRFPKPAWPGWDNWECKCSRKKCKGEVKGYFELSEEQKSEYKNYVSEYIIEMENTTQNMVIRD